MTGLLSLRLMPGTLCSVAFCAISTICVAGKTRDAFDVVMGVHGGVHRSA